MKKIFLFNLLLFFSLYSYAQEGYIGIALGSSIPLGDYGASSVNFIDNDGFWFSNVINGGNGAATSGATLKLLDFHSCLFLIIYMILLILINVKV